MGGQLKRGEGRGVQRRALRTRVSCAIPLPRYDHHLVQSVPVRYVVSKLGRGVHAVLAATQCAIHFIKAVDLLCLLTSETETH